MASTSLQPLLIFDLFLLNSTTFVVRTRGFVCVVYLLSCLASHKDPCKWCMLGLFIPQYIRTCLFRQNLFGSYMWVMGYFHKADYIFFLFTQLVNESCALHTAMVFMAWKLLWDTCKCSWSCGTLMWIKEPSTAPITQGIPAVLSKSAIVACRTRTKYSMSPIPSALRKNSPLLLKFQNVTSVVTVYVSGLTH